jgi:hypothetical protein
MNVIHLRPTGSARICQSLNKVFEGLVPVHTSASALVLYGEAGELVNCHELVVTAMNRQRLAAVYRHAPPWLYRAAQRGTYALPIDWAEEVSSQEVA